MNAHRFRNGLSVLEFIGCLMAVVGGLWLGAIYLGIDVRHVAYVALSESKLMNQVPEKWRPVDPEAEKGPSQAELAASVRDELVALRHEISSLRDSQGPQSAAVETTAPNDVSAAPAGKSANDAAQASLAYWTRLCEIVQNQRTLELDAEKAASAGNAAKVATLKARISRLSATAIQALSTREVDSTLVDYGRELADWFESGSDIYDAAVQIWGTPSQGPGNSQLTKEWEQDYAQFENEGRLLRSRATTLRAALAQQFGGEFPPIPGL